MHEFCFVLRLCKQHCTRKSEARLGRQDGTKRPVHDTGSAPSSHVFQELRPVGRLPDPGLDYLLLLGGVQAGPDVGRNVQRLV